MIDWDLFHLKRPLAAKAKMIWVCIKKSILAPRPVEFSRAHSPYCRSTGMVSGYFLKRQLKK
jgi:hypothetical protein